MGQKQRWAEHRNTSLSLFVCLQGKGWRGTGREGKGSDHIDLREQKQCSGDIKMDLNVNPWSEHTTEEGVHGRAMMRELRTYQGEDKEDVYGGCCWSCGGWME